jgi:Flp pilus assembly pilin Flp
MVALNNPTSPAARQDEVGQALVEYALIVSLVSIVCIASLTAIGTNVNAVVQAIADALTLA